MSDTHTSQTPGKDTGLFEKPAIVRILWIGLIAACVVLAALGVYGAIEHWLHPYFDVAEFPLFFGVAGAITAAALALGGAFLSRLLTRPADYYDRPDDMLDASQADGEEGNHA